MEHAKSQTFQLSMNHSQGRPFSRVCFKVLQAPIKLRSNKNCFRPGSLFSFPFPSKKNMLSKKQMCKISTALGSVFWCSWIGFFLLPPHGPHGQHLSKSSVRLLRETTEVNFPPSNVLSIPWSVLRIDVLASKTKPQKRILAGAGHDFCLFWKGNSGPGLRCISLAPFLGIWKLPWAECHSQNPNNDPAMLLRQKMCVFGLTYYLEKPHGGWCVMNLWKKWIYNTICW